MSEIVIDDSQVQSLFADLTNKEQTKVLKDTLRKAGNILVRAARKELKSKVKNANKKVSLMSKAYGTLQSGIKNKVIKEDGEYISKVHILGDFRLKFFEKGTKDRTTKSRKIVGYQRDFNDKWNGRINSLKRSGKGHFTGKIRADKFQFFKPAKEKSESQIFGTMNEGLKQSIQKILNKHR